MNLDVLPGQTWAHYQLRTAAYYWPRDTAVVITLKTKFTLLAPLSNLHVLQMPLSINSDILYVFKHWQFWKRFYKYYLMAFEVGIFILSL
jgi:hypothetical protein